MSCSFQYEVYMLGLGLWFNGKSLGSGLLQDAEVWGRVEVFVEGVRLVEDEIRLSEVTFRRLEIVQQSHWRSVSDEQFDNVEATVVCRQLSFTGGMVLPREQVLQSKQTSAFMANVSCMGYEQQLAECLSHQAGLSAQDVGVKCLREEVLNVVPSVEFQAEGDLGAVGRLLRGRRASRSGAWSSELRLHHKDVL